MSTRIGNYRLSIASDLGTTPSVVAAVVHRAKRRGLIPAERAEA